MSASHCLKLGLSDLYFTIEEKLYYEMKFQEHFLQEFFIENSLY